MLEARLVGNFRTGPCRQLVKDECALGIAHVEAIEPEAMPMYI